MFDDRLRQAKDRTLTPVAQAMRRVPPWGVTGVAFLLGLGSAGLASQQWYGVAALLWMLNRVADGLDGTLARAHGRASDFGGYLDILGDFVVYAVVPLGMVWGLPTAVHWFLLALLLSSYYVNAASWMYLSAILEKRQAGTETTGEVTSVTMPTAVAGGLETGLIYLNFLLLPHHLTGWFSLMLLLVLISILQRLRWAAHNL
jgi:phosphatidylglycerophosphate synthase